MALSTAQTRTKTILHKSIPAPYGRGEAKCATQAVVVPAGPAQAFKAALLAGALVAALVGVFFLVAVVAFLALGAAFLTGVFFFVAAVGFCVEAYMAVKLVRTAFWIFSAVKAQVTVS